MSDNGENNKRRSYKVQCMDYDKRYISQTWRKVLIRTHDDKFAVRKHDPFSLSLVTGHEDQEGQNSNPDKFEIQDQATMMHTRKFLEAWYSSNNSTNRHIESDQVWTRMRGKQFN